MDVCCIKCLKMIDYDDAVYADDDAHDDCMLCIECFSEGGRLGVDSLF